MFVSHAIASFIAHFFLHFIIILFSSFKYLVRWKILSFCNHKKNFSIPIFIVILKAIRNRWNRYFYDVCSKTHLNSLCRTIVSWKWLFLGGGRFFEFCLFYFGKWQRSRLCGEGFLWYRLIPLFLSALFGKSLWFIAKVLIR